MAPAVAVNNPRFVVNARRPDQAPQAVVTEEVLNYLWRTHRYQEEFRLAVLDWLITGHGWIKCGYKFTKPPEEKKADSHDVGDPEESASYGIDDRDDVDGNVESEMYIYDDRPFLERISLYDMFVDPDSRHPKEMCWIAQRTWRPIAGRPSRRSLQPGGTQEGQRQVVVPVVLIRRRPGRPRRQAGPGPQVVLRDHRVLRHQAAPGLHVLPRLRRPPETSPGS